MRLNVFLQILRTLEGFAAKVALVRLEGNMNADVRGDVVSLDRGGSAISPLAGEVQIVRALPTDMAFADVVLFRVLSVCLR